MTGTSTPPIRPGTIEVLGPMHLRDHYVGGGLDAHQPDDVTVDYDMVYRRSESGPSVVVGTLPESLGDFARMQELGIGAVVDLCRDILDEAMEASDRGMDYFGTYVQDTNAPSLEQFTETTAWMRARFDEGKNIYIHCHSGVGRAPTMTTAFLLREGLDLESALALVKRERGVNISPRQIAGLEAFAASLT